MEGNEEFEAFTQAYQERQSKVLNELYAELARTNADYERWRESTLKNLRELEDENERANARIEELTSQNLELLETVLDLFSQGCSCTDGKYDHMCLSSYESAQSLLLEKGVIKKEDCYRQ